MIMKSRGKYSIMTVLSLGVLPQVGSADLIAYWPFDEGEGMVATDVVSGYEGTLSAGTWVAGGKVGASAIEAFGGDEILVSPDATPATQDLTLAWWMIDNHASYGTIMDKSVTDSGFGYNILVRPREEDSPLRFRIGGWQSYGGWGAECRLPPDAYKDGEWVHIVCTYDSATDTASIYVNGELPENGDFNPKTGIAGDGGYCQGVNNVDTPLYIRGGEETFDGVIDEVAIWDQALTAEEVRAVFEGGPLSLGPGLPLAINEISYSAEAGEISLTWNSREGDVYAVKYSTDLINWDSDLGDSVPAAAGETTSMVFDVSELGLPDKVYFRIEKQ